MNNKNLLLICILMTGFSAAMAADSQIVTNSDQLQTKIKIEGKLDGKDDQDLDEAHRLFHITATPGKRTVLQSVREIKLPASVTMSGDTIQSGSVLGVTVGSIMDVTPKIQGNEIAFRVHMTERELLSQAVNTNFTSAATVAQELYATGAVTNGGTQLFTLTNQAGKAVTWSLKMSKVNPNGNRVE